jgi:isopentenyl diphosphate isomerase/L-lactate dehydrogenase-like FMN-dependent dehydrogenase
MVFKFRGLRRHVNADIVTGTKLTYAEHPTPTGLCSSCTNDGVCEVGKRARTGQTLFPQPFGVGQFGAEKKAADFQDIQIIPELYGPSIRFDEVNTTTKLGGFKVKLPLSVAAMGSTKVSHDRVMAVAGGAAAAGIPYVLGENVMVTYGEKEVKAIIDAYLKKYDGKHGAVLIQGNAIEVRNGIFELAKKYGAHGIEVKIGQGAKQGLGGEINFSDKKEATKYKKLGFSIEENADGTFQRHADPGSLSTKELRATIEKYKKLGLPIWVKTGVGRGLVRLIKDLDAINRRNKNVIKALTIDGLGGGTGMSPWLIMNETSIPSAAIMSIIKKKLSFDIILAGGYNTGIDIAKCLMLGAQGTSMGRSFNIAGNAEKHLDTMINKLKIKGWQGVDNFVKAVKEEVQMVCATQKTNNVAGLYNRRKNLFALDDTAGKTFGLPTDPKEVL